MVNQRVEIVKELSLREILQFILRWWKLIVASAVIATLGALYLYKTRVSYTAESVLLIHQSASSPLQALSAKISGAPLYGMGEDLEMEKYLLYLRTDRLFRRAAAELLANAELKKRLEPILRERTHGNPADFKMTESETASFLGGISGFRQQGVNSIRAWVTTASPELSVLMLNHIIKVALEDVADRDLKELNDAKAFIEGKLLELEMSQDELDKAIIRFRKKTPDNVDAGESDSGTSEFAMLKRELSEAQIRFEQNNQILESLREKASAEVTESGGMSYGVQNRVYRLEKENEFLSARMSAIKNVISSSLEKKQKLPEIQQSLQELLKKTELEHLFYTDLRRELLGIEVERISLRNKLQRVEEATMNTVYRSSSFLPKFSALLLLALALSGFLGYVIEAVHPVIRSRRELMEMGLPVMGQIPDLSPRDLRKSLREIWKLGARRERRRPAVYISRMNVDNAEALVFRNLRSKLLAYITGTLDQPSKVINITSADRAEGKSLISVNLAAALAQLGKKTLIIDCDLRGPAVSETFHCAGHEGLSDFLLHQKVGQTHPEIVNARPNLDVVSAGSSFPDSSEALFTALFKTAVNRLKEKYDFVILDSPPIVPFPDAIAVSQVSDLVMLSVVANQTKTDRIERAVEKIGNGKKILTVLNRTGTLKEINYSYGPRYLRKSVA